MSNHGIHPVLSGLTEICGLRLLPLSLFTLIHVAHKYIADHLTTYLFEIIHGSHSNHSLKNWTPYPVTNCKEMERISMIIWECMRGKRKAEIKIYKWHEENLGNDCGNCFTCLIYVEKNPLVCFKYVQFTIYQIIQIRC